MDERIKLSDWHATQHTQQPVTQSISALHSILIEPKHTNEQATPAPTIQPWQMAFRNAVDASKRERALKDASWWSAISTGAPLKYDEYLIEECQVVEPNILVLYCKGGFKVWLNTGWLKEQLRMGRPLRWIHASLVGKSATQINYSLAEVFSLPGCIIRIYNALMARNHVACRNFTIH